MARQIRNDDNYADKLAKFIPSEVTAGFIAIYALVPFERDILIEIAIFALSLICFFYLKKIQGVVSNLQLFLASFVAFPIWAFAIAVERMEWLRNVGVDGIVMGVLVVLSTLALPLMLGKSEL